MAAKSVAEFLQTHKTDFKLTPTNKVRSRITGHEMSVSLDVILAYFHSKKYQKAVEWHAFDVDKYDYIIPHKSDKNKMWCQLTNQPLNKIPEQIVKHVQGKKFVRLKAEQDRLKVKSNSEGEKKEDEFDLNFMQSLADASSDEDADDDHIDEEQDLGGPEGDISTLKGVEEFNNSRSIQCKNLQKKRKKSNSDSVESVSSAPIKEGKIKKKRGSMGL